jgi:hypothetical protein
MTPERSHSTPASAPRISGTARKIVCCSSPSRSSEVPFVPVSDQHKNENTTAAIETPTTHRIVRRENPRAMRQTPKTTTSAPSAIETIRAGATRAGTVIEAPGGDKWKVAS